MENSCGNCGYKYDQNEKFCPKCGQMLCQSNSNSNDYANSPQMLERPVSNNGCNFNGNIDRSEISKSNKSKNVAGILAILFGAWGVHKFYLGYTKTGIITILISLACFIVTFGVLGTLPAIIGIYEGIHYLLMSKEDFYFQYIENEKHWF